MRQILNLLILLVFLISAPAWAKEDKAKKALELPTLYQKMTGEDWLWLMKIKGHLQPFQTFPIINRDSVQIDLGPGQFQLTIPFR